MSNFTMLRKLIEISRGDFKDPLPNDLEEILAKISLRNATAGTPYLAPVELGSNKEFRDRPAAHVKNRTIML